MLYALPLPPGDFLQDAILLNGDTMKIEKREITLRSGNEIMKLADKDSDMTFQRILGGLGWPYAERPGFILVMGEDFDPDHSLPHSPHHYRVLAEHETSDLEEIQRFCHKFEEDFCLSSFLGNPENPIYEMWKKQKGHPSRISLPYDFEKLNLNLIVQLVRQNTEARKTLHFGESKIPGSLTRFMVDRIENEKIEEFPAMTAFGFILAQMALRGGSITPHFVPDRSGAARVNSRIRRR